MEKEMATHLSILAWRIPWTEEPGGPRSMGSQRVGHNWATSLHSLHSLHALSLEKEMATHPSILAWRIPGTEEPGGPWSMGSQRVGHNWSNWAHILWKEWFWSWISNSVATWCIKLSYWKDPDAGQDWRKEKGTIEDEMTGWHRGHDEHKFE